MVYSADRHLVRRRVLSSCLFLLILDDTYVLREVLSDLLQFADLLFEHLPRISGFFLFLLVRSPVRLINHDVADHLEGLLALIPPPETILFDKGVPSKWLNNQRWRSFHRMMVVTAVAPSMRQWHLLNSLILPSISRSLRFLLQSLGSCPRGSTISRIPWSYFHQICLHADCLRWSVAICCLYCGGLLVHIIIILIIIK